MKKHLLLMVLLPLTLFAQNNGDSLKFEIIKSSLSFLATDKETFKESSGKAADCSNGDYDCLKKYSADNKLAGTDSKITAWSKEKSGSQIELEALGNKIVAELTSGNASREKRKKLQAFVAYQKQLSSLATSFTETPKPETPVEEEETIGESEPPMPAADDEARAIKDEAKSESKLPLIALVSSLLALAVGGLAFARSNKGSQGSNSPNADLILLKEDLKELKNRIAQKQSVDLKPLQDKLTNIESRIANLENQSRVVELEVSKQTAKTETNVPQSKPQQSASNTVSFARYPDMSNGFTSGALKSSQNGELIYEIAIAGEKGTFTVSEDSGAQAFALSDYKNYLSDACDFANQPYKGCRIITTAKGTLSKSGGNWIIQSKAKIEFK